MAVASNQRDLFAIAMNATRQAQVVAVGAEIEVYLQGEWLPGVVRRLREGDPGVDAVEVGQGKGLRYGFGGTEWRWPGKVVCPEGVELRERQETVKSPGSHIDDLMNRCENQREELEQVRLALGLSKLEYSQFKDGGYVIKSSVSSVDVKDDSLVKMTEKLKKYLEG